MVPQKLDYDPPPRQPKVLGVKPPTAWDQFDSVLRMCLGLVPLVIGVYGLAVTVARWPQSWMAGLFASIVGLLAGYAFTVRPVYRLIRGGAWWKIE